MKYDRFPLLLATTTICALVLAGCAQPYSKATKKSAAAVANSSRQKAMLAIAKPFAKRPLAQIGRYLDSANAARIELGSNPNTTSARSEYNFAVARVIEIIEEEGLTPWAEPIVCESGAGDPWRLKLTPPSYHPDVTPANFEILPTDRYAFKGKLVGEHRPKPGIGAPIIVAGRDMDFTKIDEFAQGKQIFYGLTAVIRLRQKLRSDPQRPAEHRDPTTRRPHLPLGRRFSGTDRPSTGRTRP